MKKFILSLVFILSLSLSGLAHGQIIGPGGGGTSGSGTGSKLAGGYQAYYTFLEGSGTTILDKSGKGNNGVLNGTAGTTYVWNPYGAGGLQLKNGGYITFPVASFNNAKYIAIWYRITSGDLAENDLIAGGGATRIEQQGPSYPTVGTSQPMMPVDQTPGDASTHVVYGTPTVIYPNGNSATAYRDSQSTAQFICVTECGMGYLPGFGGGGNFIIYAIVAYPTAPTQAVIASNEIYMRNKLKAQGVEINTDTNYQKAVISYLGDSLTFNYFNAGAFSSSYPALAMSTLSWTGAQYNFAHSSETLDQMLTDLNVSVIPISSRYNVNQPRILSIDGGTNNMTAGESAATIYSKLQAIATPARAAGLKVVVGTLTPRGDVDAAHNAINLAASNLFLGGWVSGGLATDNVFDLAGDPILGYGPNNTEASHTYYSVDTIHWTTAGNQIVAARNAVAVHLALHKGEPIWLPVNVPQNFSALLTTAATSATIPLVYLGPNQSVCGVRMQVTTAFSGGAIATATASIGDSTGTATQYLGALNIKATGGSQTGPVAFFNTPGSYVNAVFTASGGNLSTFTAGNLAVQVCLVSTP